MKDKILKKLIAIVCILSMILPISSEVLAKIENSSQGESQIFGIAITHKSNKLDGKGQIQLGYAINERKVYRIYSGSNNEEGYENTILCLYQNGKFPNEDGNQGEYISQGEATTNTLKRAKATLNDEDAEKIQWLIRNALLPEDSEELREQKLSKIFFDLMESTSSTANPVTLKEIKSVLTEDDLVFALQCTIWQITDDTPLDVLLATIDGSDYNATILGTNKELYIREIINYYNTQLEGDLTEDTEEKTNPTFDEGKEVSTVIDGAYAFIGPFKINEATNYYSININFADKNGKKVENVVYKLTDKPTQSNAKILTETKEGLEGKEFYIRIQKSTTARKVKIELETQGSATSNGTVWLTEDVSDQPLLSIKRNEIKGTNIIYENNFDITIDKQYDVSLRKFITAIKTPIDENWKVEPVDDRTPEERLKDAEDAEPFNQYVYNHKKAPVEVNVGDKVVYTIRITNEGKETVIIKSVTDYLPPTGIEYIADSTTGSIQWVEATDSRKAVAVINTTLEPLNYVDIQIVCKVTEEAKGKIVTNIAEITEITDEDGKSIEDIDSIPNNVELPQTEEEWQKYKGNEGRNQAGDIEPRYKNKESLLDKSYYYKGQQDDDDFEKITVKTQETNPKIDLALRKSITHINGKTEEPNRVGNVNTTPLKEGISTTADYSEDKKTPPVEVNVGDVITYKIRVFNEGPTDAYASSIEDYIPEGLGFLPEYKGNITNGWVVQEGNVIKLNTIENAKVTNADLDGVTLDTANVIKGKAIVKTEKLKDEKILAYDETNDVIDKEHFLQIYCIVLGTNFEENEEEKILRNIAAITKYKNENGNEVDSDADSEAQRVNTDEFNIIEHEDDEDYDDVILKKKKTVYDLALKKYITSLTSANGTNKVIPDTQKRKLEVTNVDALINRGENEKVDATYVLNKTPVNVVDGDYVTYTIRVFNEGQADAIVKELIDTVPEGLEFVPYEKNSNGTYKSGSKVNFTYKWETFQNNASASGWPKGIKTKYLENQTIPAFDNTKSSGENKELGLSYAEIKVEFKVNTNNLDSSTKQDILQNGIKNIAEITEDDGEDNDSTPNNKKDTEDDQDYDIVIPREFDLALRKFITKINNKDITNRFPQPVYNDGKIKYNHTKEPEIVVKGQIVTYTIRVYNEGTQDGYATEITDDLPEGIMFLPQHETNLAYEWKMYDKEDKETEDVRQAVKIKTRYLSRQKSEENLIKAFDSSKSISQTNPAYKEVKVAFEVIKETVTDGKNVIINTAQISEDEDENGNKIDDRDSIPANSNESEDDIDKEYITLKYFDLSLLKYVSKVIVTEDGVTKETDTGYNGTENPEPVVKVELNKKKLSKTEVKYVYSIKITNEGEIEGYATEITDRIPNGLAFYEEDNTNYNWKIKESGIVTTDYLKSTLLKPGESAVIQIMLRWENSENNLGQKINTAEISADDNKYNLPDIDSTPNNNIDGEDDQDNAMVVLSLQTGALPTYISLIIVLMSIFGIGFYLIYKYVIKR